MSKKKFAKSMERKSIKQRITGISKKKIVSMAILAVAVIAIIIAIVVNQLNAQKLRRNESATNGDKSARALTKNETEETQNDDSNGIALYAADTTDTSEQKGAKAVWAKAIGGTYNDTINSVAPTSDGGWIVGGILDSDNVDLGNGVNLSYGGIIIKYSRDGEIEWAKKWGDDNTAIVNSVAECNDGGYVLGGRFMQNTLELENGISFNRKGEYGTTDGIVIKYSHSGEIEWAKAIAGTEFSEEITSVIGSNDGGCIAVGYFGSKSLDIGNGIRFINKDTSNMHYYDGVVIKYNSSGEV